MSRRTWQVGDSVAQGQSQYGTQAHAGDFLRHPPAPTNTYLTQAIGHILRHVSWPVLAAVLASKWKG